MKIQFGWIWAVLLVFVAGCQNIDAELVDEPADGADESFLASGKADDFSVAPFSRDAVAVLEVVNWSDFVTLDDVIPLNRRSAQNITSFRHGEDGVEGTDDDRLIHSLNQLDGIRWMGPRAFDALLAYVRSEDLLGPEWQLVVVNISYEANHVSEPRRRLALSRWDEVLDELSPVWSRAFWVALSELDMTVDDLVDFGRYIDGSPEGDGDGRVSGAEMTAFLERQYGATLAELEAETQTASLERDLAQFRLFRDFVAIPGLRTSLSESPAVTEVNIGVGIPEVRSMNLTDLRPCGAVRTNYCGADRRYHWFERWEVPVECLPQYVQDTLWRSDEFEEQAALYGRLVMFVPARDRSRITAIGLWNDAYADNPTYCY